MTDPATWTFEEMNSFLDNLDDSVVSLLHSVNPEINNYDEIYDLPVYSIEAQNKADIYRYARLNSYPIEIAESLYRIIIETCTNAPRSSDISHDEHGSDSIS